MKAMPTTYSSAKSPTAVTTTVLPDTDSDLSSIHYTMDEFLAEATTAFADPLTIPNMLQMSSRIRAEFKSQLRNGPQYISRRQNESSRNKDKQSICMLPSYNHALPTGFEHGNFLSLDVGGSGMRIALVSLLGKATDSEEGRMEIVKARAFDIDEKVRRLEGIKFFDWMAKGIEKMLSDKQVKEHCGDGKISVGVAWSFPIEYVLNNSLTSACNSNNAYIDKPLFKAANCSKWAKVSARPTACLARI
jgi:hexokinase